MTAWYAHRRLTKKSSTDRFIALSLETYPLNVPEFPFEESLPERLNPSYNTPFVYQSHYPSFGRSESLDLHPTTAKILDDIHYLFSLILELPPDPSREELDKVQHTAQLTHDSIERMHDVCPEIPTSSAPLPAMIHLSRATLSTASSPSTPAVSSAATGSPHSSSDGPNTSSSSSSCAPAFIPQSHDPSHFKLRKQAPAQAQAQPQHPSDFLYATVRQAALIYARAAATRSPLSAVCPVPHFFLVWSTAFRVSLNEWHRRLGLFLWVIIAVLPTAGHTPFAALAKSLLHIGAVQIGLTHWEVAIEMLRNAVRVVTRLAEG